LGFKNHADTTGYKCGSERHLFKLIKVLTTKLPTDLKDGKMEWNGLESDTRKEPMGAKRNFESLYLEPASH